MNRRYEKKPEKKLILRESFVGLTLKNEQFANIRRYLRLRDKLHSTPVKTVVTTCHNFYTDDEYVFNEKKKLCDATNEVCTARRSENKRFINIEDICSILTRRDSQGLFIPKFAPLHLNNIPINETGDPSLGQLMAAIVDLRKNMVTKEMLKSSLNDLKSETASLSMASPSSSLTLAPSSLLSSSPLTEDALQRPPPPPIAPSNVSSAPSANSASSYALPSAPSFNEIVAEGRVDGRSGGGSHRGRGGGGRGGGGGGGGGGGRGGRHRRDASSQRGFNHGSSSASQSRIIIGKKVNEGLLSMKGADLTINKYIGRVHNDVSTENMREFLASQSVEVIELEQLETKHNRFKSFRLRVKRDDLETIEERDFWPKGVLCGSYF